MRAGYGTGSARSFKHSLRRQTGQSCSGRASRSYWWLLPFIGRRKTELRKKLAFFSCLAREAAVHSLSVTQILSIRACYASRDAEKFNSEPPAA